MIRRKFTQGLLTSALASPFILSPLAARANDGFSLAAMGRIRLKLEDTTVHPTNLVFVISGRVQYQISLLRMFPQVNEDRGYIEGLNNPPLSHVFKGSKRVGDVRLKNKQVVVIPRVKLTNTFDRLHLANLDRSFLLGDNLSEHHVESDETIPDLSDIPLIGNLFRSKKLATGNRELMILIKPSIVKF